MMGEGMAAARPGGTFTEANARKTGMHVAVGHELMEYFLKR
jgi:hypothetical protein